MNEHYNKRLKKYRYKKYNFNNHKFICNEFFKTKNGFTFNNSVNGVKFIYLQNDYTFYKFRNFFWNLIDWYKRPKKKTNPINKISKIISTISKETWIILRGVVIFIIGAIIIYLFRDDIIKLFG